MSKNNENKLVPKLRFPEFLKDGEWTEKRLKDVCEINPKVSELPDEFVYIDLESVDKGELLQKKIINREEAPSRAQRLLKDNDVVFQTVRPYQMNNYYFKNTDDYDYVASTGYAQLRAFESSMFLFQLIHTESFVSKVLNKCSGSNYPAINSSDLSIISIEITTNPKEQRKIAACLSSLDEVITTESQKLEVLKEHKKGLQQNLFPKEGETAPKLRFKEFEDSGEWAEKKLKDICEINPKVSQLPDEFVYIDLESVNKGKLLQKKIINKKVAPSRAQRILKDNDVAFQTIRPYQINNYYFKRTDDYDYVASTGYAQLRAFESSMFLFQLIHTESFVSKVLNKCSGSNYPAINSSDLSLISVVVSVNPQEQEKIASCLSSIDELINAQNQKVEALKLHKKGLLQGLFPILNNEA